MRRSWNIALVLAAILTIAGLSQTSVLISNDVAPPALSAPQAVIEGFGFIVGAQPMPAANEAITAHGCSPTTAAACSQILYSVQGAIAAMMAAHVANFATN